MCTLVPVMRGACLHLGLVVQRVDLVAAARHLLWLGASFLSDARLVVGSESRAGRVARLPLRWRHVLQLLLLDLQPHMRPHLQHLMRMLEGVHVHGM